ncbi:MAG: DNA polymerase III subunit gamma/tau [Legionellaceae bacterium]|nr:DNA polymerase III subunit gamma/tau [Legionellaceae bacterium]
MSYIALARKWRPRTFSQLLGQSHLTTALINSLDRQRIHHAYLFSGTRGVGKTSVARLLAKSLNCEVGISSNPCLQCASCLAFDDGSFVDLIEIDGASKTKVEDTREILENVQYGPSSGRFKIYLIDEVHMLSQHSFNALLKTLEEPPPHVKFLLATTDPQKLPITVLSRCLQFNLKHVADDVIAKHLEDILEKENIKFETKALQLIAKAAKGSIRDSLSLLDQAIVGCADTITISEINDILGYTQQDYAIKIINAIIDSNPQELLSISKQIYVDGGLFSYVVDEIMSYLHQMAVWQTISNTDNILDENAELSKLSKQVSPEATQLLYQVALKGSEDILLAPTMLIGFEILLIRMYTFLPSSKPLLTKKVETSILVEDKPAQHTEVDEPPKLTSTNELKHEANIPWSDIVPKLKLQGLALNAAENCYALEIANGVVVLRVDDAHQSIFTPTVIQNISKALSLFYAKELKVTLDFGKLTSPSPAKQKKEIAAKNIEEASKSLEDDQFFKQMQDEFSAELIKNSIASLKDDI